MDRHPLLEHTKHPSWAFGAHPLPDWSGTKPASGRRRTRGNTRSRMGVSMTTRRLAAALTVLVTTGLVAVGCGASGSDSGSGSGSGSGGTHTMSDGTTMADD